MSTILDNLKLLAKGIDPTTLDNVPQDTLINRADIRELLSQAATLLETSVKPTKKLTEEEKAIREKEKRAKNIAQGLPERSGFAWTEAEVQWLKTKLSTGASVQGSALVKKLQRKEGAILMKCVSLQIIPSWASVSKYVEVSEEIKEFVQKQIQDELTALPQK